MPVRSATTAMGCRTSSAEGLVGNLGPVVLASPLVMVSSEADLLERSPVRAQLVGRHPGRSEAVLPEQLANELRSCGLVAPALDQDLQHLALIVNRPPQVHLLAGNANDHFVQMPA